ncbi:MAG: class I SAM-dependent DNA methyltransferase [Acidimicrobiales bacterium]
MINKDTDVPFGALHADSYDAIYAQKDYEGECDALEALFGTHVPDREVVSVLDLGCGTGNHAVRLARRGYHVTGVDRSASMIKVARTKPVHENMGVRYVELDIRELPERFDVASFDAAVMLFTVLGYLVGNDDLRRAIEGVRAVIRPGGLFVADYWYGPAVLAGKATTRVREIHDERTDSTLLRVAEGAIQMPEQQYTITLRLWRWQEDQLIQRTTETHEMRFFFPRELELLLEGCGFEVLDHTAFPQVHEPPSVSDWWACIVARSKG